MMMEAIRQTIIFILSVAAGLGLNLLAHWPTRLCAAVSLPLALLLPPYWSHGLLSGLWIGSAFLMSAAEADHRKNQSTGVSWGKIFSYALFTFYGFILALILLWKTKNALLFVNLQQREILTWLFLIMIEISFYRIIARDCHKWQRVSTGGGIGFLNFLMVLYWIYPYGLTAMVLTLITLLLINPFLLFWVDHPARDQNNFFRGARE